MHTTVETLVWRQHAASAEGISSVYLAGGSASDGPEGRIGPPRSRVQKAGSEESEQARTKAEGVITSGASVHAVVAPCVLGGRVRAACCDQVLVGQTATDNSAEHFVKPFCVSQLPHIEPERLFVQIPEQVKRLNGDVRSLETALQQRPEVLATVRVNLPVNVRLSVIDHLMHVFGSKLVVRLQRVGVDVRARFDIQADASFKRVPLVVRDRCHTDLAVAGCAVPLKQSHNGDLAVEASALATDTGTAFPVGVHVARSATDVGFINFDVATELAAARFVLHRQTDAVQHEPRGLLGDANRAVDLPRANAVLAVGDQPQNGQPLVQTERRVLKDRPGLERELPLGMTGFALPSLARRIEVNGLRTAGRARHAIGPTAGDHVVLTVLESGEKPDGFGKCLGGAHGW
jgi:hypothetical protein